MRYAAHYQPTGLPGATPAGRTSITRHRSGYCRQDPSPVRCRRAWTHPMGRKLHHNRWHRPRPRQPHNPCPPDQRGRHRGGPGPRLGYAAREVSTANGLDLLARPLSGGDVAVVVFNETATATSVITTSAVGAPRGPHRLLDIWAGTTAKTGGVYLGHRYERRAQCIKPSKRTFSNGFKRHGGCSVIIERAGAEDRTSSG
jgi:Alpha galactosidase C-terminal beta sandwich domain